MNIGEILTKAWQIVWKHKVLWIFGILAGCASGGGSGNGISYTFSSSDFPNGWQPFNFYFNTFAEVLPWLILILLITLVIVVLVIFLGTIGKIGIIRGAQKVDGGSTKLTFKELFSGSVPYFWRVFALNLLVGLLSALAIFMIIFFIIFGTVLTLGIGLLCFIPLICLLIPIGWLVSLWLEQANIAIVVEDLGITEGLSRGWQVFKDNFGHILGMGLILLILGFAAGFLISIPVIFVFVPLLWGAFTRTNTIFWTSLVISGVCLVIFLPVMLGLFGILTAYIKTAWTLTYLRLTGRVPLQPSSPIDPLPPLSEELEVEPVSQAEEPDAETTPSVDEDHLPEESTE